MNISSSDEIREMYGESADSTGTPRTLAVKNCEPRRTVRILTWSLSLLVVALGTCALLASIVISWLPRGKLFGFTLIHILPVSFIAIWGAGTVIAYIKHRSVSLTVALVAIGVFLWVALPLCFFLYIFLSNEPLNIK
jgi:hypothetical protein